MMDHNAVWTIWSKRKKKCAVKAIGKGANEVVDPNSGVTILF